MSEVLYAYKIFRFCSIFCILFWYFFEYTSNEADLTVYWDGKASMWVYPLIGDVNSFRPHIYLLDVLSARSSMSMFYNAVKSSLTKNPLLKVIKNDLNYWVY